MKIKTILIGVAVLLLLIAGVLLGSQTMSLTSKHSDNIIIDTGIGCTLNNDCRTNIDLPKNSYCEDYTCRFTDTGELMGDFYE